MFSALEPSFIMRSCNCCIDYYLKNKCFTCYSISFIIKLLCFSFIIKPSSYTLLLHLNCFNQFVCYFCPLFYHFYAYCILLLQLPSAHIHTHRIISFFLLEYLLFIIVIIIIIVFISPLPSLSLSL